MATDFDLAVVGSGFGGTLLAMIARRLGQSVVLLERGRHPRFAIGESSTPLANLLLEELAARYDLPAVAALAKWGSWQATHPTVGCGLKRGFTFFHHQAGRSWQSGPGHGTELLVGASPHDRVADTHWYRPEFDQLLVRQAQGLGVEFLDELELDGASFSGTRGELTGQRHGRRVTVRARWVVDASGPRGFLHRLLRLPEAPFATLPQTEALYSHFRDVHRWDELFPSAEAPPYPVDDAAVHHVFAGGWIWVLRFNNGITSAGLAATAELARDLRLVEGKPAWARLLERFPSVREQFRDATATLPFMHAGRLPFRSGVVAGPGWILLPSAAGFVDPLLSTGFPLTLLGVERLGNWLAKGGGKSGVAPLLEAYSRRTLAELDITAEMVSGLYAQLDDFEVFADLTLLYFAAAMYTETVKRLGQPERMAGFLQHEHDEFGPALRHCLRRARAQRSDPERTELRAAICAAIEPFNLAGLGDSRRRNWYPARAEDLLAATEKLGVERRAVEVLLERCGFAGVSP